MLTREEGTFYLNVTCEEKIRDKRLHIENGTVLGVDLNLTGPFIATSTGEFVGSADKLNQWRDEYEKTCGDLQEWGHLVH